jgi:DNA polymerase I-like protein with 3'-5' exonuclease and polymerase domains
VRRTVIPPFKDWVISSVDFSAQELRRLANRCLDTNLVAAFNGTPRIDPHALVGRGIAYHTLAHQEVVKAEDLQMGEGNKVDYDWFNKQRSIKGDVVGSFLEAARGVAKVVNFGIPYGVTAMSLSEQTRLPLEVAELALAENAESFPGIGRWKTDTINFAKYHGYIPTLFGMRRHCGNALSVGSKPEIGRWERQICNSDIQGGCGDYLGWVLAECHRVGLFGILHRDENGVRLEQRGKFRAVLYNALYDELLYACHKDDYLEMIGVVREIMERPSQGDLVKQEVDCSFGLNWKDQYEVGRIPDPENVNKIMLELFGETHV